MAFYPKHNPKPVDPNQLIYGQHAVLEALIATFGAENVGSVKVTTVVDKGDENYEITLSNGKGGTYKYDGTKLTKQK